MSDVVLSAGFDDLRAADVRLIEEASRIGDVTLRVWPDEVLSRATGRAPRFPLDERLYVLESLRFTGHVEVLDPSADTSNLGMLYGDDPQTIVVPANLATDALRQFCGDRRIALYLVDPSELQSFPAPPPCPDNPKVSRKKVLVTGCFDWLHSGHVRFFEEVSELGDLYVVVGHDANIRLLKGHGKPMLGQDERCYFAGAIRFVKQAMVSSGSGWLDAEPEIERLRPDAYAVNEDGDVPEKRDYCRRKGIEYVVLKRVPKPGLQSRTSTALRGY